MTNYLHFSEVDLGKRMKYYAIGRSFLYIFEIIVFLLVDSIISNANIIANVGEEFSFAQNQSLWASILFLGCFFFSQSIFLIIFFGYTSNLHSIAKSQQNRNLFIAYALEMSKIIIFVTSAFIIGRTPLRVCINFIPVILMFASTIYLEKSIKDFKNLNNQPEILDKVKKSMFIMKIGLLLHIFQTVKFTESFANIGFIGTFIGGMVYVLGIWTASTSLLKLQSSKISISNQESSFNGQKYEGFIPNQQGISNSIKNDSNFNPFSLEYSTSKTNIQDTYNISNSMETREDRCPFCGVQRLNISAKFCASCGQKML